LSRIDAELFHACDECGAFDAHPGSGAIGACHSSAGEFQYANDLVPIIGFEPAAGAVRPLPASSLIGTCSAGPWVRIEIQYMAESRTLSNDSFKVHLAADLLFQVQLLLGEFVFEIGDFSVRQR
jgi:hypothetical protein